MLLLLRLRLHYMIIGVAAQHINTRSSNSIKHLQKNIAKGVYSAARCLYRLLMPSTAHT
jgi:hypothetical protein